jgi:MtN3 and saliva related transmembrane protein
MCGSTEAIVPIVFFSIVVLFGCEDLVPHETQSPLIPRFQRSEIFGFIAGSGTIFAAAPDLLAMARRTSSAGMKPGMAAIMGAFQILWVYYGLLSASRAVIAWNVLAVVITFLSVGAYTLLSTLRKGGSATCRGEFWLTSINRAKTTCKCRNSASQTAAASAGFAMGAGALRTKRLGAEAVALQSLLS